MCSFSKPHHSKFCNTAHKPRYQEVMLKSTSRCPILEPRFSALKQSLIKPENKQKVIESYARLCKVLKDEVALIEKTGPSFIPEIDFNLVLDNNGELPQGFADLVRERGCCILRNVVPRSQAEKWEADLKDYISRHRSIGGLPPHNPQMWQLYWTKPQVEIRSHENVLKAMSSVSKLWHVTDPTLPIDLASQVVYPDRFRIRTPSKDKEYTLNHHLDSGGIERWEDPEYRSCYQAIFEGRWDEYDAWDATPRPNAKTDLYSKGASSGCSCWRSLQGWISLSHTGTGEGTLRLLPSMKASIAYIMLRPFFVNGAFDDVTATFPGSNPGHLQFYPTADFHPDLELKRSVVGIPPVEPGDYVFWHADLVHEVDKFHPGTTDSSAAYNPCTPLIPYNLESIIGTKNAFLNAERPIDFARQAHTEIERHHDDHGARVENILSLEGKRAMGFEKFDTEESGITEGQQKMRQEANERLGLV